MEKITITGELSYGYRDEHGAIHRAFVMRPLTLGDMERMEEEHPDLWASGNSLTLRRLAFAYALERLGDLSADAITPDLLAQLPAQDYGALAQAEEALEKKLRAACGRDGADAS